MSKRPSGVNASAVGADTLAISVSSKSAGNVMAEAATAVTITAQLTAAATCAIRKVLRLGCFTPQARSNRHADTSVRGGDARCATRNAAPPSDRRGLLVAPAGSRPLTP